MDIQSKKIHFYFFLNINSEIKIENYHVKKHYWLTYYLWQRIVFSISVFYIKMEEIENFSDNAIAKSTLVKANSPTKKQQVKIRTMIWVGIIAMSIFIVWFGYHVDIGYLPLYIPLTIGLFFKLIRMLHEWYHYYGISVPIVPKKFPNLSVDVFTTACPGEPIDMIIHTLKEMVAISYPHKNYLCDEGDDPILKKACDDLGIIHITRKIKNDAKAGNINNALRQSCGELCIILDPDHVPRRDFIDRVLPYFADENVGYVQCVQGYKNQQESLIALGATQQTYHFYGPMMMGMNSYGTVQAIGANCTFRRKALDSIGGHAAGLAEDMHTAMQIQAKGWKTLYIPEMLTKGLVPTSLSAYYKQQLKWSRGTFDLLFHVYPKLFKKFNARQKFHYGTIAIYFIVGFFSLIDIVVPIIALLFSEIPWQVDFLNFSLMFFGLFGISAVIRQYSQNWLLEKHERGFQFIGGLLRHGTWWIFILGFLYTIFNVKVPYIPTPKGDKPENSWLLSLPNIILFSASIFAVGYGLYFDWSPYSFFMAVFAFVNAIMLGMAVLIGQEQFLINFGKAFQKKINWNKIWLTLKNFWFKARIFIYDILRKKAIVFSCFFSFVFLSGLFQLKPKEDLKPIEKQEKEYGGFFLGKQFNDKTFDFIGKPPTTTLKKTYDIYSLDIRWASSLTESFPEKKLNSVVKNGAIPLINWLPEAYGFSELSSNSSLSNNLGVLKAISNGSFDSYINDFCIKIKALKHPVFINFAPEPDNPYNSWSITGGNSSEDFIETWQYLNRYFTDKGVYNVTWVWNVWKPSGVVEYFPGTNYVDWIGLPILNEANNAEEAYMYSFEALYESFYQQFQSNEDLKKMPVMITQFGSVMTNTNQKTWFDEAFKTIKKNYPEIKSLVFYEGIKKSKNIDLNSFSDFYVSSKEIKIEKGTFPIIASNLASPPFINRLNLTKDYFKVKSEVKKIKRNYLIGKPGNFQLLVKQKPFYIKGIAFNPGHDWRDGNWPLTRGRLEKDLQAIKNSGANTIRRYSPGFYDRNILNTADDVGLKVIYGFWFDPEKDYLKDTEIKEKYRKQITELVTQYKDHPSILGWSIGNETWGLLKHNYGQPYLTIVRNQYMLMVEEMAQLIHQLDPTRPVLTACEHSWKLSTELSAWHENAPSIDIIAVNSYYEEQISKLDELAWRFDSSRPYLVSEFGPRGYWNPEYSTFKQDSLLLEDSDSEKAWLYAHEWKDYVNKHKGKNIGGFAYCWRDRMEGSNTWFGITDYKGRKKPVYHALREQWTGKKWTTGLFNIKIIPLTDFNSQNSKKEFKAEVSGAGKSNLTFEWFLNREDYLEKVGEINVSKFGDRAWITIPNEYSKYRLYVYACDELGNVTTASIPLR